MIKGRVLIIAGSDSGGGAGIQADIKTATALGAYAMTAVTAVTAQDTNTVHDVHVIPPAFVGLQIRLALADIGADVIKTGMIPDEATIEAVCEALAGVPGLPLVLDPVMIAKGGARLFASQAMATLKQRLLPLTHVMTPNLPEAEALVGIEINGLADMRRAAMLLLETGVPAVLLKGGHLPGETVVDILATGEGVEEFSLPRIDTRNTHGTGCTLATALAVGLAQRFSLREAVIRARAYVRVAIATAPGFGAGHGPLDHTGTIEAARLAALSG